MHMAYLGTGVKNGGRRLGLLPDPSIFHEDGGYDFDYNCGILFKMEMIPNIKQRMTAVNRGKSNRSRAAKFFDKDEYKQRGMIEGIFWGGVQAPPTALQVHPLGQPPAVSAGSGPSLGSQGAEPSQVRPHIGDRDTLLR